MDCPTSVEWRDVPGYDGAYSVSSDGRVRSNPRKYRLTEKILKTPANSAGYPHASLGKGNDQNVHVLVALAFLGEKPEGTEVRHLDDEKTHNCAHNLAYGTRSENVYDSIRNGKYNGGMRPRGFSDLS